MIDAILIRPAHPQDFPAMKAILRDTFERTWRPEITEAAARRYIETDIGGGFVAHSGADMLVAEADGRVAGLVHCVDDFIDALHVHSDFQRRGVGRRLLARAERDIAEKGFPRVRLETDTFNEQARGFYRALGYVETAHYPDEEWQSGLTTVLMEKPLGHVE